MIRYASINNLLEVMSELRGAASWYLPISGELWYYVAADISRALQSSLPIFSALFRTFCRNLMTSEGAKTLGARRKFNGTLSEPPQKCVLL